MGARKEGQDAREGEEEGAEEGRQAGSGQSEETLIQVRFFHLRFAACDRPEGSQLKESERQRAAQAFSLTNERGVASGRSNRSPRCPPGITR